MGYKPVHNILYIHSNLLTFVVGLVQYGDELLRHVYPALVSPPIPIRPGPDSDGFHQRTPTQTSVEVDLCSCDTANSKNHDQG